MIEDFTPARTTLSSGVVVKQNLLERNVYQPPSMSFTTPEYTGSVKSFARDYNVHYAKERPGENLFNDQVITASAAQNTVNLSDGRGATAITGSSNGSGFGATFVPLVVSNQITQFQVIETGSKYSVGEVITFTSQSISSSVAPILQSTPGSPTSVANDVNITIGENNLAPILGPSDFPQQNYASGSTVYRYNGGTGGVFEPFNNLFAAPVSQSQEEYNYFFCFTSSISSTAIASSSLGFFGFNGQDGATATKMFMNSLSKGNRPVTDYGPNLYTNLTRISKSMADFPGKFGLEIEFEELTNLVNKVWNPAKNNYARDIKAKYRINSLNYISPPLITATPVTVTRQPNTSLTTAGSSTTATIGQSSTSGNGSGATFQISTIPLGNAYVAVTIVDIGLDYNEGETVTFTASDLQAAGFPCFI